MNKNERRVAEKICNRFTHTNTNVFGDSYDIREFEVNKAAFDNIGLSYEQITDILSGFVEEKYLSMAKREKDGWKVRVTIPRLEELYFKAIEGRKLSSDEVRQRKFFEIALKNHRTKELKNEMDNKVKKEFEGGKWLRLCCPACGDFIQEITDFKQLKELEGKEIECRRNKHKCQFNLEGNKIVFKSLGTEIIPLLREKRSAKVH